MFQFMEKSPTVFPNALLSKQDFQKEEHFHKKCMVFVFMTRWVYGPGRPETMAQLFPKGPEDEYESIRIVEKKRSIGNEALSRVPKTSSCV